MNDLTAAFLSLVLIAPSIIVLAALMAQGARRVWNSWERACSRFRARLAGRLVRPCCLGRGHFASREPGGCGMLG